MSLLFTSVYLTANYVCLLCVFMSAIMLHVSELLMVAPRLPSANYVLRILAINIPTAHQQLSFTLTTWHTLPTDCLYLLHCNRVQTVHFPLLQPQLTSRKFGGKLGAVKLLDSVRDYSRNKACQHQSLASKPINLIYHQMSLVCVNRKGRKYLEAIRIHY